MLVTLTPDQDGVLRQSGVTVWWLIRPVYTFPIFYPGKRPPRDRVSFTYTNEW